MPNDEIRKEIKNVQENNSQAKLPNENIPPKSTMDRFYGPYISGALRYIADVVSNGFNYNSNDIMVNKNEPIEMGLADKDKNKPIEPTYIYEVKNDEVEIMSNTINGTNSGQAFPINPLGNNKFPVDEEEKDKLNTVGNSVVKGVYNSIFTIGSSVSNIVSPVVERAYDAGNYYVVQPVYNTGNYVAETASNTVKTAAKVVAGAGSAVQSRAAAVKKTVVEGTSSAVHGVSTVAKYVYSAGNTLANGMLTGIHESNEDELLVKNDEVEIMSNTINGTNSGQAFPINPLGNSKFPVDEEEKDKLNTVGNSVVKGVYNSIFTIGSSVSNIVSPVVERAYDAGNYYVVQPVYNTGNYVAETASNTVKTAAKVVAGAGSAVQSRAAAVKKTVVEGTSSAVHGVSTVAKYVYSAGNTLANGMLTGIHESNEDELLVKNDEVEIMSNTINGTNSGQAFPINPLGNSKFPVDEEEKDKLNTVGNSVVKGVYNSIFTIGSSVSNIVSPVVERAYDAGNYYVVQPVYNTGNYVAETASNTVKTAAKVVAGAGSAVQSRAAAVKKTVVEGTSSAVHGVSTVAKYVYSAGNTLANGMLTGIHESNEDELLVKNENDEIRKKIKNVQENNSQAKLPNENTPPKSTMDRFYGPYISGALRYITDAVSNGFNYNSNDTMVNKNEPIEMELADKDKNKSIEPTYIYKDEVKEVEIMPNAINGTNSDQTFPINPLYNNKLPVNKKTRESDPEIDEFFEHKSVDGSELVENVVKQLDLSAKMAIYLDLVEHFKKFSLDLHEKQKNNKNYEQVAETAYTLYQELEFAAEFFETPTPENFKNFKEFCQNSIKEAEVEFKKHRDVWYLIHPIFRGILGVIATLAVIPALVVAATKQGYVGTFFATPETASAKKLAEIKSGIESECEIIQQQIGFVS